MVNIAGQRRPGREREGRKTGFTYRARSADNVRKRAERQGGRFDSPFRSGIDMWRAKDGDNLIRILPPTWGDNEDEHYAYQIWVHSFIGAANGTYLCPLKMKSQACPICKEAKLAKDSGDQDEARSLQVAEKWVCWVIDRKREDDSRPLLYLMSWTMDRDIAALTHDKRTGKVLLIDHPDEGFDLTIMRAGQGLKTKYYGQSIGREACPIHDDQKTQDEIMDFITENPIPDLLVYHSVEHMAAALSGEVPAKDEDLDEDNTRDARGRQEDREARGSRRVADVDDDVADEVEDEVKPKGRRADPEEDDDRPKRRSRPAEDEDDEPKGKAPADDDEDTVDDDEDEPPRRASRDREERVSAKSNGRRSRDDEDDEPPAKTSRVPARPTREERRPRR